MARAAALSSRTWTVLLVALSGACAFTLRVVIPYQAVLGGDAISFLETDAWYHMRLVDALVRDFPNRIWFDPYLQHPGGDSVHVGPFFDWAIAAAALLLGAGSPGARLIDQVGAFMPAIFGALTVVPVYVLGRELFSRRAGLWASAIVGVLPGHILLRSLLGFTDHHAAEVLLSTVSLMFVVLALRGGATHRQRLIHGVSGGFGLGCYLLTWSGGALLVAVLAAWAILQMLIERYQARTGGAIVWALVPGFVVAGLMVLPWAGTTSQHGLQVVAVVAGGAAVLLLHGLALATLNLNRGWAIYLSALLASGVMTGGVAYWLSDDLVASILGQLARLSPGRTFAIAGEAQPLMASQSWRPVPLWDQFKVSLFLAVFALGNIASEVRSAPRPRKVLLLVWTGGMLLATIGQVRFSYYLAVNVALCAGYACDVLLGRTRHPVRAPGTAPTSAPIATAAAPRWGGTRVLATVGLAALLVIPNVSAYRDLASIPANPPPDWADALYWLRHRTPEPFDDPQVYYTSFDGGSREDGAPPRAAYGVLTWWDYGYWILRQGRRVPIANPKQSGVRETARFLLAEDESEAAALADDLDARYVIVSWELQARLGPNNESRIGVLDSMTQVLGAERTRYVRVAYKTIAGERQPVILYEPAYYRAMLSRLYRADLNPSPPRDEAWAVTLEERTENGLRHWELVAETSFSDYEEARAFVEAARSPNVRLVGRNPFVSCVPLPPLRQFTQVYRSLNRTGYRGHLGPSSVQIFERAPVTIDETPQ